MHLPPPPPGGLASPARAHALHLPVQSFTVHSQFPNVGGAADVQDTGVPDYEQRARLSQFQGSQAISSSDYFGRDEGGAGGGGNPADFDVTAGELLNKLSVQVGFVCHLSDNASVAEHDPSCICHAAALLQQVRVTSVAIWWALSVI